eukprot:3348566-Pleurochrysis_carterae.AAC.8
MQDDELWSSVCKEVYGEDRHLEYRPNEWPSMLDSRHKETLAADSQVAKRRGNSLVATYCP